MKGQGFIGTAVFAALMVVACGTASAATVSFSSTLAGNSNDSFPGTQTLTSNGDLSVAQFDPSLGTLNSVTLVLTSVFNYGTQFENRSPSSVNVAYTINQRLVIGDGLLDTSNQLFSFSRTNVPGYDGVTDFAGTSGFTEAATNGASSVTLTFFGPDLAPYIGTSGQLFAVTSYADYASSVSGGNFVLRPNQSFATTATVTYDYSPVPLPAAAWLLLSGVAGLGSAARRRRT